MDERSIRVQPENEYASRLERAAVRARRLGSRERRLGDARLVVFLVGLVVAWAVFVGRSLNPWSIAVPVAVFVVLALWHARVLEELGSVGHRIAFYRRSLGRMRDEPHAVLDDGSRFSDDEHPYSCDLDLFGPDSLFARLCTAHTEAGRETLAAWLERAAPRPEILSRQQAVAELAERLDLREDVAVLGAGIVADATAAELDVWGRGAIEFRGLAMPWLAGALAAANLAATLGWLAGGVDRIWLLASFALSGTFVLQTRKRVAAVLGQARRPAGELRFIANLLERFERESFRSDRLRSLQSRGAGIDARTDLPSRRITALARLIEWDESRRNQLFLPLAALLLLGTQLALAIERWRARNGADVGDWLREVGEIEALGALATFRFENPDFVFAQIETGPPAIEALGLAHPLLPRAERVGNDVRLGGDLRLLLVSGSNMSGKSTLLRSVGIAAVLAYAGAPVCASSLRITSLAIGASLHVRDSLANGVSRFYAELRRLARVRGLAEAGPTLFLLDEILHGTNSHDREIGATGMISMLLDRDAIGLVTTHDLALARVAEELAPRAANVHFEDHLDAGRMAFDYKLRPGPVTRGNALALMRSLGLRPDPD